MIYGYIRVSSDKQTVENQRFEISNFCNNNELTIGLKKLLVERKITQNDSLDVYCVKYAKMILSSVVSFHVLDAIFL
jgi:hypothetical protein